ncbi:MAG: hypothetical protein ACFCAD_04210 [Pleurocapsa sp.]
MESFINGRSIEELQAMSDDILEGHVTQAALVLAFYELTEAAQDVINQTHSFDVDPSDAPFLSPKVSTSKSRTSNSKGLSKIKGRNLIKNKLPASKNGKLLGEIVNGKISMKNNTQAAGEFDFIVTAEGRTLIGRKHTFLSGGADVQAAGTMKIRNGKIVNVTNLSGHYLPNPQQGNRFLDVLKSSNVDVSRAHLKVYDANGQVVKHVAPPKYGQ